MSSRTANKTKSKKPLDTTLGRATVITDLSHVRKPIDTSIFSLDHVLQLVDTASDEVRRYIKYECDIMYECRICRTIYRSLANFVLHKRKYCPESYNPLDHTNCRNNCQQSEFNIIQNDDDFQSSVQNSRESSPCHINQTEKEMPKKTVKRMLNSVVDRLLDRQKGVEITQEVLNKDLSNEPLNNPESVQNMNNISLERIEGTDVGVFQTMFKNMVKEHMKSEVMEVHQILDSNEAIIGYDGKVLDHVTLKSDSITTRSMKKLICSVCNLKFSTEKTLRYHVQYKHNNTKVVYPCPICYDTFANAWGVFRHLYKIHRKTNSQIRKLRAQIHASGINKGERPKKKDEIVLEANGKNEENQWMDNIEGGDFQMCGGCGKRFERKAALHSHSQMCMKRIAVCNSIKESTKKFQADDVTKNMAESINLRSSKRKPSVTKKSKQPTIDVKMDKSGVEKSDITQIEDPIIVAKKTMQPTIEIESDKGDVLQIKDSNVVTEKARQPTFDLKTDKLDPSRSDIIQIEDTNVITKKTRQSTCEVELDKSNACKKCDVIQTEDSNAMAEKTRQATVVDESNNMDAIKSDIIQTKDSNAVTKKTTQPIFEVEAYKSDLNKSDFMHNEDIIQIEDDELPNNNDSSLKQLKVVETDDVVYIGTSTVLNKSKTSEVPEECTDDKNSNKTNSPLGSENEKSDLESESGPLVVSSDVALDDNYVISNHEELSTILNDHSYDSNHIEFSNGFESKYTELNTELKDALREISAICNKSVRIDDATIKKSSGNKRKASPLPDTNENKLLKTAPVAETNNGKTLEERAMKFIDKDNFICVPCDLQFLSYRYLMMHMAKHFNWFCFQCSKCLFMSSDVEMTLDHVKKQHCVKTLFENAVLPIPSWRTNIMATEFKEIDIPEMLGVKSNLKMKDADKVEIVSNSQIEEIMISEVFTQEEKHDSIESYSGIEECLKTNNQKDLQKRLREIILGANVEMDVSFNASKEKRHFSMKLPEYNRPARNRTRSVNSDFVYDLLGGSNTTSSRTKYPESGYGPLVQPFFNRNSRPRMYTRKEGSKNKIPKSTEIATGSKDTCITIFDDDDSK